MTFRGSVLSLVIIIAEHEVVARQLTYHELPHTEVLCPTSLKVQDLQHLLAIEGGEAKDAGTRGRGCSYRSHEGLQDD